MATKAEPAQARAVVSTSEAMIAGLKFEIALLRRETYGHSAERTARLIDQLELQLEELVAITGSQVSTVVLLNHTAEGAQHAMTATRSVAPTLLVAIDISKRRHEVLIGIPGKTRRRRFTVTNTLEDFNRLSKALASYDLPVRIGFEGQTMGLAATAIARWRTISVRPAT